MLRSIWFFLYLWGYMLLHPFVLRRGLKAVENGDFATADEITKVHVTKWCTTLLHIAGADITVTGAENIPQDRPCVFTANHRGYFDIPVMLTQLGKPIPLISKIDNMKFPLIRDWMKLLHCLFIDREDPRQSIRILNEATELLKKGYSVGIFPEGTRYKGEEGGLGEFLPGAFRMASKAGAPVVPVVLVRTRALYEANGGLRIRPAKVEVHILPAIETAGMDRTALKELPAQVESIVREELKKAVG